MKIEAGKYYKRRDGKFSGVAEIVHGTDPVRCGSSYYGEDGYYYNSGNETEMDLTEECNADGSPVVPVEPAKAPDREQWAEAAEKMRREEIALSVLPGLLSLGSDLECDDLPPTSTLGEVAVHHAFYIADVFLKAAKQS